MLKIQFFKLRNYESTDAELISIAISPPVSQPQIDRKEAAASSATCAVKKTKSRKKRVMTSMSNILEFWRAVELFSPQSLPKVNPNDRSEPVFALDQSLPLPWEASHPFKSIWAPAKTSRRFLACCGVLEQAQIREVLEEKLGKDPEAFDERTDGQTCLFAFSVTDDGRPLLSRFDTIGSSCNL